jgi:UDP-N-acetylmuramate--alanine ligase
MEYAFNLGTQVRSYGLKNTEADYTARNLNSQKGAGFQFQALRSDEPLADVSLQVPGEFNVLNALGALVVVDLLGLDVERAAKSLQEFSGAGRRFEVLGEAGGVLVIDDYGHHPTEIKATLAAARARYPKRRLWAVWQPHTYSRTQLLLAEFGTSFKDADQVIVTKVYAARETLPDGFSHKQIVDAIKNRKTHLVRELDETAGFLLEKVKPGDVVIVFSAGDAVEISALLYSTLKQRELRKS